MDYQQEILSRITKVHLTCVQWQDISHGNRNKNMLKNV